MTLTTQSICTFAYQAQTVEGQPLSGTIDAASADEAVLQLEAMHLRVIELVPAGEAAKPKALRGDDFIAFNQQLGYLTAAGLPIEQGLRLIAQDMRSGRLSTTVRQIADELDKGVALGAALERHQGQFPSMYGRLIEAGVRANNLPGMLFSLSRHLELVRRMRAMLWRSSAYPLMVMVGVAMVRAAHIPRDFRELQGSDAGGNGDRDGVGEVAAWRCGCVFGDCIGSPADRADAASEGIGSETGRCAGAAVAVDRAGAQAKPVGRLVQWVAAGGGGGAGSADGARVGWRCVRFAGVA
jgi:hypothetical protein